MPGLVRAGLLVEIPFDDDDGTGGGMISAARHILNGTGMCDIGIGYDYDINRRMIRNSSWCPLTMIPGDIGEKKDKTMLLSHYMPEADVAAINSLIARMKWDGTIQRWLLNNSWVRAPGPLAVCAAASIGGGSSDDEGAALGMSEIGGVLMIFFGVTGIAIAIEAQAWIRRRCEKEKLQRV